MIQGFACHHERCRLGQSRGTANRLMIPIRLCLFLRPMGETHMVGKEMRCHNNSDKYMYLVSNGLLHKSRLARQPAGIYVGRTSWK